jgi:hypothetical protein
VTTSGNSDHDLLHAQISIAGKTFLPPHSCTPSQRKARLKTTVTNADLENFNESLTLRTATKTERVRSKLADLLTTARKVTMQTDPTKTSKERLHDSGITPDLNNTLGCEIKTIITEDGMAVARETLEFTSPTDGPPKLYIPSKLGRAMRISKAISIYLRHAIKAYDSLLVDGSLPDSNLELLNHTLENIAPPTTQSRSQQGHEALELFSDPIETCENATDTRQK